MKIELFQSPILGENFYLVIKDNKCIIIDPGYTLKSVEKYIYDNKLEVLAILVTHYHFDHIGGLDYFKEKYNSIIIDYKTDSRVMLNNFNFEIIKTLGHTLDSVSFYFKKEKIMFTGDFLFKESIGNYESKNEKEMLKSLSMIKKYNPNIKVYPGHGESTTLKYELENNIFLRNL